MARPKIVAKKTMSTLESGEKWELINDWMQGKSNKELADTYNMRELAVRQFVSAFSKSLIDIYETKALMNNAHAGSRVTKQPSFVNTSFTKDLSGPNDPLTDKEQLYCQLYVINGDSNPIAMKGAELDTGITGDYTEDECIRLRGQYLRAKANIALYIKELQDARTEHTPVTKEFIQRETLTAIHRMKEAGSSDANILKAIRMLGETEEEIFSKQVKMVDVKPKEEMDALFEIMRQEQEALDAGTEGQEDEGSTTSLE